MRRAKQINSFPIDNASDVGTGIWCSKATVQRHTELGDATTKRMVHNFPKHGIFLENSARGARTDSQSFAGSI